MACLAGAGSAAPECRTETRRPRASAIWEATQRFQIRS